MATIRLETNVPIPLISRKRKPKEKYPLSKMKIGDSFLVPKVKMTSVAPTLLNRAKQLQIKLTMRTLPEGVRVWRIA